MLRNLAYVSRAKINASIFCEKKCRGQKFGKIRGVSSSQPFRWRFDGGVRETPKTGFLASMVLKPSLLGGVNREFLKVRV